MVRGWMYDNKSTDWVTGCRFVQWQKNFAKHRIIGRSPYTVLFGGEPRIGSSSTNIPTSILRHTHTEEEFEGFLGERRAAENEEKDDEEDGRRTRQKKISDAHRSALLKKFFKLQNGTATVRQLETLSFWAFLKLTMVLWTLRIYFARVANKSGKLESQGKSGNFSRSGTVSYTHLTLPTIYSV